MIGNVMLAIIIEVCTCNKIHPTEFFGQGRDRKLSRARRIAIHRLKQAGFSINQIAGVMRRHDSTIQYWLYPQYRKRRSEYARRYRAARAAA